MARRRYSRSPALSTTLTACVAPRAKDGGCSSGFSRSFSVPPPPNSELHHRRPQRDVGEFNSIATADNLMVARAGYSAAAMFYDKHEITLQQGTYIIMDSRRDGLPRPMTLHNFQEMREMEREVNSRSAQPTAVIDAKASKAG